jgi:hypothetical protein
MVITSVVWEEIFEAIQANPNRGKTFVGAATMSVMAIPSDNVPIAWLPTSSDWTEDTTFTISDVVSFVLWVSDLLYRTATPSVRRIMEMEEASRLLNESETAWKTRGGKARGWVRKHLEEDLRSRSAGGDPDPDFWEKVRTTRRTALLVDYVCVMRSLQIACWWPTNTGVSCTAIPLSFSSMDTESNDSPTMLVQLNCVSGNVILDHQGDYRMPKAAWVQHPTVIQQWVPPACAPSIGTQTVAQIAEQLTGDRKGNRQTLWNRLMWERFVSHSQ